METAIRTRLPDERQARTVKLTIGGRRFYAIVGFGPDGQPGELFIHAGHAGDRQLDPVEPGPLLDAVALAISLALQYGAPLDVFLAKFRGTRFAPAGFTGDPDVPAATSILDYLARKLSRVLGLDLGEHQATDDRPAVRRAVEQVALARELLDSAEEQLQRAIDSEQSA